MAYLFLISIGNTFDDSNYSKVIISPEGYTVEDIKQAIDIGYVKVNFDKDYEFIQSITMVRGEYCAFTEDDFLSIETTLKNLNIIK